MSTPPFNFGQVVYRAWASTDTAVDVPCPVCYGKLQVTIICGNGEHVPIACDACGLGYTGPRGVVSEWRPSSRVLTEIVDQISFDGSEWRVRTNGYSFEHIFATKEEAEAERVELHAEAEINAAAMNERNILQKRRIKTWNVRYHRDCLKRLQAEATYHEKQLLLGPTILKEKK